MSSVLKKRLDVKRHFVNIDGDGRYGRYVSNDFGQYFRVS